MIYKEVLTSIDEDDFLSAGDRVLAEGGQPDQVSLAEWQKFASDYKGLASIANYIAFEQLLKLHPKQGKRFKTGAVKAYMTLREYFVGLQHEYDYGREHFETNQWLQNLSPKFGRQIISSYLHQQTREIKMMPLEEEPTTAEIEMTAEEYPALIAFGDLLEERLEERWVSKNKAQEIAWGANLAAIVLREVVEMTELEEQLAYVVPETTG
jgi:hypothetical protein